MNISETNSSLLKLEDTKNKYIRSVLHTCEVLFLLFTNGLILSWDTFLEYSKPSILWLNPMKILPSISNIANAISNWVYGSKSEWMNIRKSFVRFYLSRSPKEKDIRRRRSVLLKRNIEWRRYSKSNQHLPGFERNVWNLDVSAVFGTKLNEPCHLSTVDDQFSLINQILWPLDRSNQLFIRLGRSATTDSRKSTGV